MASMTRVVGSRWRKRPRDGYDGPTPVPKLQRRGRPAQPIPFEVFGREDHMMFHLVGSCCKDCYAASWNHHGWHLGPSSASSHQSNVKPSYLENHLHGKPPRNAFGEKPGAICSAGPVFVWSWIPDAIQASDLEVLFRRSWVCSEDTPP